MPETDLQRLAEIVVAAGDMAKASFDKTEPVKSWDKQPGHPVTEADLAVNSHLREALTSWMPQAGWLSEETADRSDRADLTLAWVVDPIDGTRDFMRKRTGWAVSVALIKAGVPVLAVLHAPARKELWLAQLGQGAWMNGDQLRASQCSELSGARVPTDSLPKVDQDLVAVRKPNSIALRMAMVASNQADLLATLRWGFEWDIAAAALIASEAGAKVTDALGGRLAFNKPDPKAFGVLCSSLHIHDAAIARIADRAKSISAK